MRQSQNEEFSLKSFKDIKSKAITLPKCEVVRTGYLTSEQKLPLVMEPAMDGVDLVDWAKANSQPIQEKLLKYGAILFRGFKMDAAGPLEQFAHAVCRELYSQNGEHPREIITGQVYTPVFYPPDKHLLWHNENSFNETWPTKILFCCLKPAERGGETPVVDSREVYKSIDRNIRKKFTEKKIMYLRNYGEHLGLSWQTVFQTTNCPEVERSCKANGFAFEWRRDGGLRTRCIRPATIRHPQTGEMSWFNQAQHWHISCLEPRAREGLMASFDEQDLPRNCYYGDGSRIEDSIMKEILGVYRKLEVSFPWKANDILLLDNILTAHARNLYEGERKMLVAMGDMLAYRDLKE
jgi:alpha-ketoglutarate-dependent taurine dioxygenase